MSWWRSKLLGRVLVLSLLLWTAVDLANASVCALDNEQLATGLATPNAAIHSESSSSPGTPTGHVDDCFCCSHCVDVEALAVPLDVASSPLRIVVLPQRLAHLLSSSFYHPPQASLL